MKKEFISQALFSQIPSKMYLTLNQKYECKCFPVCQYKATSKLIHIYANCLKKYLYLNKTTYS